MEDNLLKSEIQLVHGHVLAAHSENQQFEVIRCASESFVFFFLVGHLMPAKHPVKTPSPAHVRALRKNASEDEKKGDISEWLFAPQKKWYS